MSESEDVMASRQLPAKELASRDFRRQLEGYGLTTAQILYRLPDHPSLLQTYVWQDYDLCPRFPVRNRFLAFWLQTRAAPLHSVTLSPPPLLSHPRPAPPDPADRNPLAIRRIPSPLTPA